MGKNENKNKNENINTSDLVQWHTPFRGAVKIELDKYNHILEYIDEKVLTKKPLLMDLLVIKKRKDKKIDHPIANLFQTYNVMEFKGPTDYVCIDDFYKVLAYAYLLKIDNAETVDAIKYDDITISFVCNATPTKVFNYLTDKKDYSKNPYQKGIVYFSKKGEINIQFIILNKLNKKYKWLTALTNEITEEMFQNMISDYKESERNEYKEAVIHAIMQANKELLKKIKEDETMISRDIIEIFVPNLDELEKNAEEKGMEKGKEKGKEEEKIEIATSLLGLLDEKVIAEKTKLPLEKVRQLKKAI